MDDVKEEWRDVSINKQYEVSNLGRVRNKRTGHISDDRNNDGYPRVSLRIEGRMKPYLIHRLVAKAFIPNPENKPMVDHINRVKGDNRVSNLRWATPSENARNYHTYYDEPPLLQMMAEEGPWRNGKSNPYIGRIENVNTGEVYSSVGEAARLLNVSPSGIYRAIVAKKEIKRTALRPLGSTYKPSKREYRVSPKKVKYNLTGEVFHSVREAARQMGWDRRRVARHCHQRIKHPKWSWA